MGGRSGRGRRSPLQMLLQLRSVVDTVFLHVHGVPTLYFAAVHIRLQYATVATHIWAQNFRRAVDIAAAVPPYTEKKGSKKM